MSEVQADYNVEVHPEPVGEWVSETQPEDGRMALAALSDAEAALARATEISEILNLRDTAQGVHVIAIAQGLKDVAQQAKIFQLKAERKAGEWLAANVGDGPDVRWHDATGLPEGVDKYESSRWQLEASLPEERFHEWIDECLAHSWELSAGALRKIAANHNGKHADPPELPAIRMLKGLMRLFVPGTKAHSRAYELIAELSALVMEATK